MVVFTNEPLGDILGPREESFAELRSGDTASPSPAPRLTLAEVMHYVSNDLPVPGESPWLLRCLLKRHWLSHTHAHPLVKCCV